MRFGTKKSEAPEVSGDGLYLRNWKDGDTLVRFLEECDDWIEFREHYTADKKSYPCTNDRSTCPGCTADSDDERKSSRKYATNVLFVKGNYVAPVRIPITLAKKMFTRSERNNGTITNRDYIVIRSGQFLDTEYDVESDDSYKVNIKELLKDAVDIEDVLVAAFEENAPGHRKEEPKSRRSHDDDDERPSRSRRRSRDDEDDDERPARRRSRDDDDDEDERPARARRSRDEDEDEKPARSSRRSRDDEDEEPEVAKEDFPSEADDESAVTIDEDELFDMTVADLKKLAAKADIDIPSGAKKSEIIRAILAAAE